MDSEFTIARVNSRLENYAKRLDSLLENDDISPDEKKNEISQIKTEIEDEINLAEINDRSVIEWASYVPALKEALLYIEKISNESSTIEDGLYNAAFSLRYFKDH